MQTTDSGSFEAQTTQPVKSKKCIYIAGKVTGEDENECRIKFEQAEKKLEESGYDVINPFKMIGNPGEEWKKAMRACISMLMDCDAIYMLPCWPKSRGAIMERYLSGHLGIEIIEAEKIDL